MTLDFINWNVNPEIFRIGSFAIRWYGLLFVASFIAGFYILKSIFDKEGYKIELLDKLTMYMLVATIVGARLGHCLFYQPGYFLKHPFEILKIWEGGLASHGAAIGIIIAIIIFAKKYPEIKFLWLIDKIVIVVALSGFFIRVGNLMNSEIIGRPTDLPFGFYFLRLGFEGYVPRHPTQIYEAICYLAIFIFLYFYYKKYKERIVDGQLFGIFLISLFTIRLLIEFLKEPQVDFENNLTLDLGQLLSLPFIIGGIILLIWIRKNKTVKTVGGMEDNSAQ
jgi:phosphatidylglycerol---prolipoprotein diacylglyceryl transferase